MQRGAAQPVAGRRTTSRSSTRSTRSSSTRRARRSSSRAAPTDAAELYYQFARIVRGSAARPRLRGRRSEAHRRARPRRASRASSRRSASRTSTRTSTRTTCTSSSRRCAAKELFKRDVDYLVADGEVKIVDEFTGRILEGRRWSEGLHQAVEAKEGVQDQGREPDARDGHAAELLPHVREAVAA